MRLVPFVFFLYALMLTGCATLSKDECLYANWEAIGMEDGARGRDLSYLSRHRQACAKHGVSPDIHLYRIGYSAGLKQFCTPERGFSLGLNGSRYSGICPDDLETEFLPAYRQGYAIHQADQQVKKITAKISDQDSYLADINAEIKEAKAHIITSNTPEKERAKLLKNLDILRHEKEETRHEIYRLRQSQQESVEALNLLKYNAGL